MQSSAGLREINRSFTALSKAQWRVRWTLRTVVLLRPGLPLPLRFWNGVGPDNKLVAVSGGRSDVGLGVEFVPAAEPGGYRVVLVAGYVQTSTFLLCLGQLLFHLSLRLAKDVLDDPLAGPGIVAGSVPSLPATVLALADVALSICSFLCHGVHLLVATHHTTPWGR